MKPLPKRPSRKTNDSPTGIENSEERVANFTPPTGRRSLIRGSQTKSDDLKNTQVANGMTNKMDRAIVSRPNFLRRVLIAVVIALMTGVSIWAYISLTAKTTSSAQYERVTIGSVVAAEFIEFVPVTGSLIPKQTVYLDSVDGGRVTAVLSEAGDHVAAGTALVNLQNTDLELQVMGREAQYTEQLSNLARAQIEFDQTNLRYAQQLADAVLEISLTKADLQRRLPEKSAFPVAEIERLRSILNHQENNHAMLVSARAREQSNAQRNLARLQDSVSRMEQSLDILRGSLSGLAVTAPIEGQLSTLDIRVGEVIAPGARIGQIDLVGDYKVRAFVDEHYLSRLAVGQVAIASFDQGNLQLEINKIYPNVENRQFEIDLLFKSTTPTEMRRGQTLRMRIELGASQQTLTVPNGAFFEDTGGLWAYVVSADRTTAEKRPISLGRRNAEKIEVLDGLSRGQAILISSYEGFGDADRILLEHQ